MCTFKCLCVKGLGNVPRERRKTSPWSFPQCGVPCPSPCHPASSPGCWGGCHGPSGSCQGPRREMLPGIRLWGSVFKRHKVLEGFGCPAPEPWQGLHQRCRRPRAQGWAELLPPPASGGLGASLQHPTQSCSCSTQLRGPCAGLSEPAGAETWQHLEQAQPAVLPSHGCRQVEVAWPQASGSLQLMEHSPGGGACSWPHRTHKPAQL